MKTAARILSGLLGVILLMQGVRFIFDINLMMSQNAISANGLEGLSTIRTLIAGPLLSGGLFALIAAIKVKKEALYVVGVNFGLMVFARLTSIALDGYDFVSVRGGIAASILLLVTSITFVLFKKGEHKKN